jgi:hypothetical protein
MHYAIDVDWPSLTSEPSLLQILDTDIDSYCKFTNLISLNVILSMLFENILQM